jgi:hypothetical protein
MRAFVLRFAHVRSIQRQVIRPQGERDGTAADRSPVENRPPMPPKSSIMHKVTLIGQQRRLRGYRVGYNEPDARRGEHVVAIIWGADRSRGLR